MARYGILKSSTNTGLNSELIATFSAPLSIISKKPSLVTETLTLKRKTAYTDIQRWELQTGIVPVADASQLFMHNVVNGYSESFYVRMPQIYREKKLSTNLKTSLASKINNPEPLSGRSLTIFKLVGTYKV